MFCVCILLLEKAKKSTRLKIVFPCRTVCLKNLVNVLFSFSTLGQISVTAIAFCFFFLKTLLMRAFLIQILNRRSKRIGLCEGSQVDVIHGCFLFLLCPRSLCSTWTLTVVLRCTSNRTKVPQTAPSCKNLTLRECA